MTPDKGKANILIVDDKHSNIKVLMGVLEKHGYEVRTALDGRQAVASAVKRVPDLILLDVRMPEMDGFEACRQLKADERTRLAPIIFLSALGQTGDIVQGLNLGGADYIVKPFRIEEVLARVETHLSIQALQKQLQCEIQERKRAEKALQQLNAQLEQRVSERTARLYAQTMELSKAKEAAEAASIAKGKFLSKMGHEMRTPLNPIMGYTQILKRQNNLTDIQKGQLQIVVDSCKHLTALISDILELVRIDTHKARVVRAAFNLQALIRAVASDTQKKAQEKSLAVHYEEINALPEMVYGDGGMLRKVLLNLLDNAVKYTEHGGLALRTSVVQSPASEMRDSESAKKWRLRFEVMDTGVGIPEEHLDDIFEPFFQTEMDDRQVGGTGLGLTLGHRLVVLMGGRLSVQSPSGWKSELQGGPGSTFTVELDFESAQDDRSRGVASTCDIRKYQGQRKRLLIVHDKSTHLNLLVDALELQGFDIVQAGSGREALIKAAQCHPDLILMDLLMPGMDGLEVLQHIRRNEDLTKVQIIGVSAAAVGEKQLAAFTAACDDFIEKPVSIEELLEKIEEYLEIKWIAG
ncbi:MAG: response regulator [Desulfobacteraceae bacterium]|jgi:DNA-binding response OmpR family regulator